MIANFGPETEAESLQLATNLRSQNIPTLLYPTADKLGKQFKYASDKGIPFVAVLGPDEVAQNKITIKNMATGEQQLISSLDIVKLWPNP